MTSGIGTPVADLSTPDWTLERESVATGEVADDFRLWESALKLPPCHALDLCYEYVVIQPTKDRSHWTIRKFGSHEELRCQQVKDWQALDGAERRQAAWELVVDYWVGMKGVHPDELRLQRSVTHLSRM